MNGSVLVTYASAHGSTHEVADAIARRLREHELDVVVLPVDDVGQLDGFDAVVLGAALYMGRMHKTARRFLREHREELAALPTAVFAMGPLTSSDHDVAGARKQLEAGLRKLPNMQPVETAVFGGVVHPEELRFPFNRMRASDARDWAAIEAWADRVATTLADALVRVQA